MLFFLWLACNSHELPSVHVRHETGTFFGAPWPNHKRLFEGYPDLSNFPNPAENPLISKFIAEANKLDGFGTTSPVYFSFDDAINLDILPTPADSLLEESPIQFIDVDPTSPYRGEKIPFQWDYQETATNWQPANFLSIAPVWGFPLRPNTLYAVVLRTELVDYDEGFPEVWEESETWYDSQDPILYDQLSLMETWESLKYKLKDIGSFTLFRTQDPVGEMASIAHRIDTELAMPSLSSWVEPAFFANSYIAYDGELLLPLWQYGTKPYSSVGGGFSFEEGERPHIHEWEHAIFRISVPVGEMPEDGWPVAIYSHGTGGSYETFADEADELEPAKVLADAGFMGIGISQPIHAERGTGADPEIYSFNYLNPTSARAMFRQGALDQIYMARMMASQSHTFDLGESSIFTNPEHVVYVGHSHGGEVGAIALPFMSKYIDAAVLSGAGGGLSVTLLDRELVAGGLDVQQLLANAVNLAEDEVLDTFHPAVGLVQMLAEVVDPINYARYWFSEEPYWSHTPTNVLMTEGLLDVYTPPASIEILAATAGMSIVGTAVSINTAQELLGLPNPDTAQGNITDFTGNPVTGGLVQYPEDGHFAIFYNRETGRTYRDFLASTLTSKTATIRP